jgi:mono/diheme cytochrome c family protein
VRRVTAPAFTAANTSDPEAVEQVVRNGRGKMPVVGEEWDERQMKALTDYLDQRFGDTEERVEDGG